MKNQLEENDVDSEEIQKTFLKMKSNMGKNGYTEGIEQGRQKVYQQFFDRGYSDGFRNGYTLGKLKGKLWAKSIVYNLDRPNIEALEKSTTGACILCKEESFLLNSISDIGIEQTRVLSRLITTIKND